MISILDMIEKNPITRVYSKEGIELIKNEIMYDLSLKRDKDFEDQ